MTIWKTREIKISRNATSHETEVMLRSASSARLMAAIALALLLSLAGAQEQQQHRNSDRKFPAGLNLYCKQRSCYDVLELPETATLSEVKKAYRRLSLKNHPDKSDSADAREVFMEIATAYEVLGDDKMRKAYDDFLAHPERHVWEHYGHYYGAYYAPKSDVRLVVVGILVSLSALQFTIARSRRQWLADRILEGNKSQMFIKRRVVEMGGEKLNLKKDGDFAAWKALEAAAKHEVLNKAVVDGKPLSSKIGLLDLLLARILLLPLDVVKGAWFHIRWLVLFTLMKRELGVEERSYTTRKVMSMPEAEWDAKDAEEREELLALELWLPEKQACLLYTSPSPRDATLSRMPSSA